METSSVAGILLAAGLSRRFGPRNKLLAPFRGLPLVLHSARTLRQLPLCQYIAVCGRDERLAALLKAEGFEVATNLSPELGLSMSLVTGIGSVQGAEAALICLGDMPLVPASHLAALVAALSPGGIVALATDDGRRSPPAAFSKDHFAALSATTGDVGARSLIGAATTVRAAPGQLYDFDTPEDFANVT